MKVSPNTVRVVQKPASIADPDSECSPSDLRDTDPQPLYMFFDNVKSAHARGAAFICFLPHQRFSELSRDVPPIGRGLAFAPGNIKTRIHPIADQSSQVSTKA